MRAREESFKRYAQWEALQVSDCAPQDALAGAGWLYELLPQSSRRRPLDASGVIELHRCLAVLAARR